MTVFLTTQYLEEADALADRVGIIDDGRIVAEGTPEALKAEIGQSSVEAVPADRSPGADMARVLERFGDGECPHHEADSIGVRLKDGEGSLAARGPRARRREHRGRPPPAARADAGRRVPGQDRPHARGRRARRRTPRPPARRRAADAAAV